MTKKPLRILVVDDDTDNANSLAELFQMEGHRADVVYSGEAAVAAYGTACYDIAFMDVMMPGKNGVDSFLEIRKLQRDAKVYMMTGYSVEELLQQAIDNGAMGVLSKPVSVAKVLAVLQEVSPAGIVLIAEDDPDFGPELKELIEGSGMQCELVQNGRGALDKVMAGGVDILILDLKMPLIDGVEVYTQLKEAGRTVTTIIITGNGAEYASTFDAIKDVAISGILNKPFDPMLLLGRLDNLAA